jgi:hypothetical protein
MKKNNKKTDKQEEKEEDKQKIVIEKVENALKRKNMYIYNSHFNNRCPLSCWDIFAMEKKK